MLAFANAIQTMNWRSDLRPPDVSDQERIDMSCLTSLCEMPSRTLPMRGARRERGVSVGRQAFRLETRVMTDGPEMDDVTSRVMSMRKTQDECGDVDV